MALFQNRYRGESPTRPSLLGPRRGRLRSWVSLAAPAVNTYEGGNAWIINHGGSVDMLVDTARKAAEGRNNKNR